MAATKTRRALVLPEQGAEMAESPWGAPAAGEAAARAGDPAQYYAPPAAVKAKRGRGWEQGLKSKGKVVASYRIPVELRDRISEMAINRLHVAVDDLARVLLENAINQVEDGSLELRPRPKEGRLTL